LAVSPLDDFPTPPGLADFVPGAVVAPGVVVVVAPGVVGVVALGVEVVGVPVALGVEVAPGVVVAGVVPTPGTAVVGVLAAGVVTVVVARADEELDPPASFTSAAARTASASAATTAIVAIGAFQLGVAASRVRAAAPQRRHQSWSGLSGVPHSGQASPPAIRWGTARCGSTPGAAWPAGPEMPPGGLLVGGAAAVTSRLPAGG
jgi:hypothetical protein